MENKQLVEMKQEIVDKVQASIQAFQKTGELNLPPDYSVGNALKSAWLMLQGITNNDKKPVLEVCTRPSVMNALLSMVIQGLSPDKKQCYFIPYGPALTMMRSYFGSQAVAKRLDDSIDEIVAEVVYEGDEFEFEQAHGKKYVTRHKSALANIDKTKIIAAYAEIIYKDGRIGPAVIKTMAEIGQAWNQGQIKPMNADGTILPNTTHGKFTADMCKKTVITAICKPIINNSDDSSLLVKTIQQNDMDMAAAEADETIATGANQGEINVTEEVPEGQASFVPQGGK
jgi:recombination protein RecT